MAMRPKLFVPGVIPCLAALALAGAALAQEAAPKSAGASVTASAGGPRVFKLTNSGKSSISAIYAAPAGTNNLSDDLLGKQVAGAGKTVTLKVNDKDNVCVYDLELLMNNGDTENLKAVDLCKASALNYPQ
jgi:hypothetical protein